MKGDFNSSAWPSAFLCLLALLTFSAACTRGGSQPGAASLQPAKRYALEGKVISVDQHAGTVDIDNKPITGFMDAMIMPYPIKPATALDQLRPGDSITADVVVAEPGKYWLENLKITAHSKPTASKPSASIGRERKTLLIADC